MIGIYPQDTITMLITRMIIKSLHKPSVNHLTDGLCLFQSKNSMIVISTIKDVAIDERK